MTHQIERVSANNGLSASVVAEELEDSIDINAIVAKMNRAAKPVKPKPAAVTYSDAGIVFQPPVLTEKEKRAMLAEQATPLKDVAGRPRWVQTRLCWCSPSGDECRLHSTKEAGWETCPKEPKHNDPEGRLYQKPRSLYASNPEFGKPRDVAEVLKELEAG